MASSTGDGSFVNIQRRTELQETKFLTEDFENNWRKIWHCGAVNPEKDFVETKAYVEAKKALWYRGWVTLCGYPGDGISCMAEHLVCDFVRGPWDFPEKQSVFRDDQWKDQAEKEKYIANSIDETGRSCYTPVFVTCAEDYKVMVDPNQKQIVVIDDIFGKGGFDWSLWEGWRPLLEDMLWSLTERRPGTLVVVCVNKAHLERAPGEINHLEWFRPATMVDMTRYKPGDAEIVELAAATGPSFTRLSKQEMQAAGMLRPQECMGLLFRVYQQVKTFSLDGNFFRNPWPTVSAAIDKVYRFDRIFYYTMSVAILLDGNLDLTKPKLADYDPRTRLIMERLIHVLEVPQDVDLAKMRYAAKKLTGFFLQPVAKWVWEFSHPRIFYLCAKSFCDKAMPKVLGLFSRQFLLSYIRTSHEEFFSRHELILYCGKENHLQLAERFTMEILSGHLKEFLQNGSCGDEAFVSTWFQFMKDKNVLSAVICQRDKHLNRSMLYWACYYGQGPVVKEILESVSGLNLKNEEFIRNEQQWGLQAACGSMSQTSHMAVKGLVECGVDINTREKYEAADVVEVFGREMQLLMKLEAPPIHVAAQRGHAKTVDYLLGKGASLTEKLSDGYSIIHRAACRNDKQGPEVVKVLVKQKANLNVLSDNCRTPIQEAILKGNIATVRALADSGAEFGDYLDDNRKYMSVAVESRSPGLVRYLLNKNMDPNGKGEGSLFHPLHTAVYNNDTEILDLLLARNVDVNVRASNGWTPLHVASFFGNYTVASGLISQKALVNSETYDHKTPLHLAAQQGHLEICNLLLDNGARTDMMTAARETPVVLAARAGHQMVVWLLLQEGMYLADEGSGPGARLNSTSSMH